MALRQIREIGDPVLTKKCREIKEITPKIVELAYDMAETMYEANGVGLAGPQVGVLRRIVVIDCELDPEAEPDPYIMINPVIVSSDGEQTGSEGCLSVPGKAGMVTRPNHVIARYIDLEGNECEVEGEGLLARAICHELDHLDGKLYTSLVEGELLDVVPPSEEEE